MSTLNYDPSKPNTPYVRVSAIRLYYPDKNRIPYVEMDQVMAVQLADGTIYQIDTLPTITHGFDFANDGADPIPMVSPVDGSSLGANTSLNGVFTQILAVVRQLQNANNP